MVLRGNERERAGLRDQLLDAFDPLLGFAACHEVAQTLDDLPGSKRLLGSLVHRVHDHRRAFVATVLQQPLRSLEIVRDGRQRLVELVSER